MTFLEGVLRSFMPSSRVEVRLHPAGGVEARVRYSDMDWESLTHEQQARRVAEDFMPRRRRRRRLHWGKRR